MRFYALPVAESSKDSTSQKPPLSLAENEGDWFDFNGGAMPPVGVEPTLPYGNRILSPARLPIPPQRQVSMCFRPSATGNFTVFNPQRQPY